MTLSDRKKQLQAELRKIERQEKAHAEAIGREFVKAGLDKFKAQAMKELYLSSAEIKSHIDSRAEVIRIEHEKKVLPHIQKMQAAKKAKEQK